MITQLWSPTAAGCGSACETAQADAPSGEIGPSADRDGRGRFMTGNRAALVVGVRSSQFWQAADAARREVAAGVIADLGHAVSEAPRALVAAADGLAQAVLIRDAAFARIAEAGGPLTTAGRTRRALGVWLDACTTVERHARLLGLTRKTRSVTFAEALARAEAARE